MKGIDLKTFKGAAGQGAVIPLAQPANSLALSAQGTSVFFVRARGPKEATKAPTATPDPAANSVADGWIRVSAAESPPSGKQGGAGVPGYPGNPYTFPPEQQVAALEVWCDTAGAAPYLAIVATT